MSKIDVSYLAERLDGYDANLLGKMYEMSLGGQGNAIGVWVSSLIASGEDSSRSLGCIMKLGKLGLMHQYFDKEKVASKAGRKRSLMTYELIPETPYVLEHWKALNGNLVKDE